MKDPVDHVLRPKLPWRMEDALTECGYDASKVPTITRAELRRREKDYGQQRAAMLTCMTCAQTAKRWKSWEDDPREAIGREVEWESSWRSSGKHGNRLLSELKAIQALIESHPEEFSTLLGESMGISSALEKILHGR